MQPTTGAAADPIPALSLAECRNLRAALAIANFTEAGVAELVGDSEAPRRHRRIPARLLHMTSGGSTLATLIRLFLLNVPVSEIAARSSLAPANVDACIDAGLLSREADGLVRSTVRFMPVEHLIIASDIPARDRNSLRPDWVLGATVSAMVLRHFTLRNRFEKALDMGTGGGIQAFFAAPHCGMVYGFDTNERAIEFAKFNARLNDIHNVEFMVGDTFAPVEGRKFDLIVSNPPFMISPGVRYVYRDSGMEGDEFVRKLVREAPAYLEEGGFCQLLGEWVVANGVAWEDRLRGWFDGAGCDIWALATDTRDISKYAEMWIDYTEPDDPETADKLYDEWTAYYLSKGISEIVTGSIHMHKVSGRPNWIQMEEFTAERGYGEAGPYIETRFKLGDFLAENGADDLLLARRLRVSPDVKLLQTCEPSPPTWQVVGAEMELASALRYRGKLDRWMLGLVSRCDGTRTLQDLVQELAAATRTDYATIAPGCLDMIRNLVRRGFLWPEGMERQEQVRDRE